MKDFHFQPDSAQAMLELADYLDFLEQEIIGTDIDLKLPENLISPGIWADRIRATLTRIPDEAVAPPEPEELEDFHEEIRGAVLDAVQVFRKDDQDVGTVHRILATGARRALAALPSEAIGRDVIIEECARVCEESGNDEFTNVHRVLAEKIRALTLSRPSEAIGREWPHAAINNLTHHQFQCDMDGVMVQVSRQALDEVLTYLAVSRPTSGGAA